jgi:hypothetical protein
MGNHKTYLIPRGNGRKLETLVYGPPEGHPLVFHRWTPGATVPFGILERPAAERGCALFLIPDLGAAIHAEAGVRCAGDRG